MLSLIRRLIHSKVGLIVTFAFLALVGIAFAATDITGLGQASTASGGDAVATVGKTKITAADLTQRAQDLVDQARQRQPGADMAQFLAQGGLDGALGQMMSDSALEQFGRSQGIVVSKKAVDGQIASIPGMIGPDGKFSNVAYQQFLSQRRLTDARIRSIITSDVIRVQMLQPIGLRVFPAQQVPAQLALPYASLLLEKRAGQVGFIPTAAVSQGPAPTDAELTGWYGRNIARYTVPERRAIRYAMITGDQIKDRTTPSADEVAQAYQSQRATYGASEKRTLVQVILPDQAAATALANAVRGGTAIDAAARAAGLDPLRLTAVDKAAYTAQASPALADAVFAAAGGAVVGPVRGALGYTVVRVENIEQIAARSLDQVRGELTAAVTKQKTTEVLGKIHDAIDDGIAGRSTFAEIVADQKLSAQATPALLADGRNPDDPTKVAAPDFLPIVAAAFAAEQGDSPQMVPIGTDGGFALVALDRVVAPAAPPPAQLRSVLARDLIADRTRRAARAIAAGIVAKASKGGAFPAVFAASGVRTPPIERIDAARAQLASNLRGAPPALVLLFSMSQGTTKLLEAPDNRGWLVIHLDRIDRGNAAGNAAVITAMRGDLGRSVGAEYAEQFTGAIRNLVGTKKNPAAIASVRATLGGQAGAVR